MLDAKVPQEGFVDYRDAASMLQTRTDVIRVLVAEGILSAPTEYRSGVSKLVTVADTQRFAEKYVAAAVLAKQFNFKCWFRRS